MHRADYIEAASSDFTECAAGCVAHRPSTPSVHTFCCAQPLFTPSVLRCAAGCVDHCYDACGATFLEAVLDAASGNTTLVPRPNSTGPPFPRGMRGGNVSAEDGSIDGRSRRAMASARWVIVIQKTGEAFS